MVPVNGWLVYSVVMACRWNRGALIWDARVHRHGIVLRTWPGFERGIRIEHRGLGDSPDNTDGAFVVPAGCVWTEGEERL